MSWVAREGSGFQKRNCWLEQSHCGINNSLRWNPLAPIPLGIPVSHYILLLPILAQESVVRYPPLFHPPTLNLEEKVGEPALHLTRVRF